MEKLNNENIKLNNNKNIGKINKIKQNFSTAKGDVLPRHYFIYFLTQISKFKIKSSCIYLQNDMIGSFFFFWKNLL